MSEKKLTQREKAIEVIKNGGGYMLKVGGKNKIFTAENVEELPSDADMALASGSPELSRMAAEDIDAQIEALQAQKKKLASQKDVKEESKKPAKSEDASAKEENK